MIGKQLEKIGRFNEIAISFDDDKHKYLVLGKEKQSVSSVLKMLKTKEENEKFESEEFQNFLRPFSEFGTKIHKITELIDNDCLPDNTFDDWGNRENEAIRNFREIKKRHMEGWKMLSCELMLYSFEHDLCGTIDRLWTDENGKTILLDIKTGHTRDSHWQQQLIYRKMLSEWDINVDEICLLSTKNKNKLNRWSELQEAKRQEMETNVEFVLNEIKNNLIK